MRRRCPDVNTNAQLFLVEDDASVRESLQRGLEYLGYRVRVFNNAIGFLDAQIDPDGPAVLIADMRMPVMSGVELQFEVQARHPGMPVIFISGESTVPQSIQAMKQGAVDFLVKPFELQDLVQAIDRAICQHIESIRIGGKRALLTDNLAKLTPREREVFGLLSRGLGNRELMTALSISLPTAKQYKSEVKKKLGISSVAELVELGRLFD